MRNLISSSKIFKNIDYLWLKLLFSLYIIPSVVYSVTPPEMSEIPYGCFYMGSKLGEEKRNFNETVHPVCMNSFKIAKYPVTSEEYAEFLNDTKPKNTDEWIKLKNSEIRFIDGSFKVNSGKERFPVNTVTQQGARAYAKWISEKTGLKLRIPTESEWEYAARAGKYTRFHFGNDNETEDICDWGNVDSNTAACRDEYMGNNPVGAFPPNEWGLYDTIGNVWEWTCSKYVIHYGGYDNSCSPGAENFTIKGGSSEFSPRFARSAFRDGQKPGFTNNIGFRLVEP